jgi:hypothetical protein
MPNDFMTDPKLGARPAASPNFAAQQRPQPKRNDGYLVGQQVSGPVTAAEVVNGSEQVGTGTGLPR